jgi:beta-galactosidase
VRFAIAGGTILGVGNGDPSSHEPDRFLPTIATAAVENWRGRIVASATAAPATEAELQSTQLIGDWKAPLPKSGESYELAADLTVGTLPADATLELFPAAVRHQDHGRLNGTELARDPLTHRRRPGSPLTAVAARLPAPTTSACW